MLKQKSITKYVITTSNIIYIYYTTENMYRSAQSMAGETYIGRPKEAIAHALTLGVPVPIELEFCYVPTFNHPIR